MNCGITIFLDGKGRYCPADSGILVVNAGTIGNWS